MSIRNTVRKQYQAIINEAANATVQHFSQPKEGWIVSVRKALGMSVAQLARITGKRRESIYASERSEVDARATLKSMQALAEAMGCKFVYAIVPAESSIADLIQKQARRKAIALVNQASTHMALEKQSLSEGKLEAEIERLTLEIINKNPSDFWNDS